MSVIVGICGGSGSGKSTLAGTVVDRWCALRGPGSATIVSFDLYYRDQSHLPMAERARINYDHPSSLDGDLLAEHLAHLRAGREVALPGYDFATYARTGDVSLLGPTELVVVEGILLFAFEQLWELLDYRVFRDCPEEVRFRRRVARDVAERGRTPEGVRLQLEATVRPMHERYVQPHAGRADYVTEHGRDLHEVADELLARLVALAPG